MRGLAEFCFECLNDQFNGTTTSKSIDIPDSLALEIASGYGLFVTYYTLSPPSFPAKSLRGCIGTVGPLQPTSSITSTLQKYALYAAFEDPRFPPVEQHELHKLGCTVTLLHSYRSIATIHDLEIGEEGVEAELINSGVTRRSVFLPQVIVEQGWRGEELLAALSQKAGVQYNECRLRVFKGKQSELVLFNTF